MLQCLNMKKILSVALCSVMLLGMVSVCTQAAGISAEKVVNGVAVTGPEAEGTIAFAAAYSQDGQMIGLTSLMAGEGQIICDPETVEEVCFFMVDSNRYAPVIEADRLNLTAVNPTDPLNKVSYGSELLSFVPMYDYIALAFCYNENSLAQWESFQIDRVRVNGLECSIDFMDRQTLEAQLAENGFTLEDADCESAFAAAYINFEYDDAIAAATEFEQDYMGDECPVLAFTFEVSGTVGGKTGSETFTIRYLDSGYGGLL